MNVPQLEMIPIRHGVKSDAEVMLDVLVRVTPPLPEVHFVRPPLNLGLVLDHSGSMAGRNKMNFARDAACFAVEQLLSTDRVSVTIFDNTVETIVRSTPAKSKAGILEQIRSIQPDGSTDLHAGWAEGGAQVSKHLVKDGLNRVLVLSDGLTNTGLTDPNAIVDRVKAMANLGVSTTTMGVGDEYDEDLLEAIANGGDGNYYYIESPRQLADIFQSELQGLMATSGVKVSLGLEPAPGVMVSDVLNDLPRTPETGRLMLPNLVAGNSIQVVVRLKVTPSSAGKSRDILSVRLAWNEPKKTGRQSLRTGLDLPAVSTSQWQELDERAEVREQVALLLAARARREAVAALARGDMTCTQAYIGAARDLVAAAPPSPLMVNEMADLGAIQDHLDAGELQTFQKKAKWQRYKRGRGNS